MLVLALLLAIPSLDRYAGTYTLVPQESDNISAEVERVVSKMNFLIRGMARSRLTKTQVPFPTVTVISDAAGFRIRHAGGTDIPHPDLATPVPAKAPDGAAITVRLTEGPPLRESYESSEGKRENIYSLSDDGRKLILQVRVTSPRLPEDIQYKLVYARAQ